MGGNWTHIAARPRIFVQPSVCPSDSGDKTPIISRSHNARISGERNINHHFAAGQCVTCTHTHTHAKCMNAGLNARVQCSSHICRNPLCAFYTCSHLAAACACACRCAGNPHGLYYCWLFVVAAVRCRISCACLASLGSCKNIISSTEYIYCNNATVIAGDDGATTQLCEHV